MQVAASPTVLESMGIGSCMVIVLFDAEKNIAAMAHAMLPLMTEKDNAHPLRYVDSAIDTLIETLRVKGSTVDKLEAHIAGGAQMFKSLEGSLRSIGARNVVATKEKLKAVGIPIVFEDTGRTKGRRVQFDTEKGLLEVL